MKDWIGRWFALLEQEGEYTTIDVGHRKAADSPLVWRAFAHAEHDGISALLTVLTDAGRLQDLAFPKIPMRPRPPAWRCAVEYLRYLWRLPLRPIRFKAALPQKREAPSGRPTAVAWHSFTIEETRALELKAKGQRVTMNSLLLAGLDRAVRPLLAADTRPSIWMLPVFLNEVDFTKLGAMGARNRTSFVDVYISDPATAASVEATVRTLILRGAAWGGWVGLNTFRVLGELGLRMFLRLNPVLQPRTGAFTNLGRWEDRARRHPEELWLGFPPVLRYQPIGASAVTWNGRLEVGLWLHPSLGKESALAEAVVSTWAVALGAV